MGDFVIKPWVKICAWITAGIIVSLNVKLVIDTIIGWIETSQNPLPIYFIVIPIASAAGILLTYVTFSPLFKKSTISKAQIPHEEAKQLLLPSELNLPAESRYKKIAVTVDFSLSDSKAVKEALEQGGKQAEYILIHVVETAGALMMSDDIGDHEATLDEASLNVYVEQLKKLGLKAGLKLGYGNPKLSIPDFIKVSNADLLVMGAHGHGALKDIAFGTTLESVRHSVKIPVMIVRE